ncbi:MAG TPA: M1 family metallopeptidase [Cytophagales bacterium]|nr:M1 family metallopeptidase [Cytophagales bacterium]
MKNLLIGILLLFSVNSFAQEAYWQQHVDYTIDVSLNDKEHTLKGFLNLVYTNNSPDTLNFIWFHLWPNAYKNKRTAFAKQLFRDKDGKKLWKSMKDKGSIDSLNFHVNGQKARIEEDPENIDIIKILLPSSLEPGKRVTITTPFLVKLPTYISRMGHHGNSYMLCQWYPKPAVYDRKGWHPMPYLDQGEFYSEFGSFNVNITLPSSYIVGASGLLENESELAVYKETGGYNYLNGEDNKKYNYIGTSPYKTLNYSSDSIHDFAWFADKDFIIEYDTLKLASGKTVDVFAYHQPNGSKHWEKGTDYIKDAVKKYSGWIGEYPYPVVQAVEGPDNANSGGMEYPMITLITKPDADEESLDAVITHEVGHNWFFSILGSNERTHAWMDEGINSYYQFRYEAEKYRGNSLFGNNIPKEVKAQPADEFLGMIYNALSKVPMEKPIETPSASFTDKQEYGAVVYLKAAIWMYILELSLDKNKLDKAIQTYYDQWKFKHPYPEDLKAIFEKTLKVNIDPLFEYINKEGALN